MGKSILISDAAQDDLEAIFEYGYYRFGELQALAYLDAFDDIFQALGTLPEIGISRNEIAKNCRSFIHRSHLIFYDFSEAQLRIIRILHASRDIKGAFHQ